MLSGIVLQKLYKSEPKEVTGVCSLPQFIYSIGWDGRLVYGNFDMIWDHFSRSFKLYNPLHAPCAVIYLLPMLIGC